MASDPGKPERSPTMFVADSDKHSLTVATRLAKRRPHTTEDLRVLLAAQLDDLAEPALDVAVETGEPIGQVLAELLVDASPEIIERIVRLLPEPDYATAWPLRELSVVVDRRFLEGRGEWDTADSETRHLLGSLTHNLGRSLMELGQEEEALTALAEAVGLFRGLGSAGEEDLVTCLKSYGTLLNRLGRPVEALRADEEAVGLLRYRLEAVAEDPAEKTARELELAGALTNFGTAFAELERHEEALEAIDEAVALYRRNAADPDDLDDFALHAFAIALTCRGNELQHLDRLTEAVVALEEAEVLTRQLAAQRDTAFQPDLALARANLAILYGNVGRLADAGATFREATKLYRRLAQQYPEAFREQLAWVLSVSRLPPADDPAALEEIDSRREAVTLYRELAARRPELYELLLASALNELSASLADVGEYAEIVEVTTESVEILQSRSLRDSCVFRRIRPPIPGQSDQLAE